MYENYVLVRRMLAGPPTQGYKRIFYTFEKSGGSVQERRAGVSVLREDNLLLSLRGVRLRPASGRVSHI